MAVRAVRGATCLSADDRAELLEATSELVLAVLERNDLTRDDLISIVFTRDAGPGGGVPRRRRPSARHL